MHNENQITENNTVNVPELKAVPFKAVSHSKHIQADGVYTKATYVRENVKFYSKKLPQSHMTILAHGEMLVVNGEEKIRFIAPAVYVIPAETRIMCFSMTDCVYYCIHVTDETDLEKLEEMY